MSFLFGEAMEHALDLSGECDEGVPCAVDREVVATGVEQRDLAPEVGHGAEELELAGEELLEHDGELDVLLDALRFSEAGTEVVDVAGDTHLVGVVAALADVVKAPPEKELGAQDFDGTVRCNGVPTNPLGYRVSSALRVHFS